MKKEIIGYKLNGKVTAEEAARFLDECSEKLNENGCFFWKPHFDGKIFLKAKKTGVLDVWFEPVYEEDFKVGDWVTIIKGRSADSNRLAGRTLKIKAINTKFKYVEVEKGKGGLHYNSGKRNLPNEFRKATPEEIKATQKTIIKMHSSNKGMFEIEVVDGKAYYRPENKELPKEWIRNIINGYGEILIPQRNEVNPYSVIIAELHVGCMKDTRKEDWETVYKLLK